MRYFPEDVLGVKIIVTGYFTDNVMVVGRKTYDTLNRFFRMLKPKKEIDYTKAFTLSIIGYAIRKNLNISSKNILELAEKLNFIVKENLFKE